MNVYYERWYSEHWYFDSDPKLHMTTWREKKHTKHNCKWNMTLCLKRDRKKANAMKLLNELNSERGDLWIINNDLVCLTRVVGEPVCANWECNRIVQLLLWDQVQNSADSSPLCKIHLMHKIIQPCFRLGGFQVCPQIISEISNLVII